MNKPNYAASHEPPSPYFLSNQMGTEGRTGKSRITPLVRMKKPERRNPSPPPPSSSHPWYSMWLNWMRIPWGDWNF